MRDSQISLSSAFVVLLLVAVPCFLAEIFACNGGTCIGCYCWEFHFCLKKIFESLCDLLFLFPIFSPLFICKEVGVKNWIT
jgi:hypothetical protein